MVSVYWSIKNGANVLPVETCSAQICGFHIDHVAGSFSLIFAIVINIPFVCCLGWALGAGVRFQNPLEAISSFITISHSLPLLLATHSQAAWALSLLWHQVPLSTALCHLVGLWSATFCLLDHHRASQCLLSVWEDRDFNYVNKMKWVLWCNWSPNARKVGNILR